VRGPDPAAEGRDTGRGQARTRLARRAVVDAGRVLFAERGYAGTTVESISDRSDVPSATVYRLFGSKLGILEAVLDVSIAGDDERRPLTDRPEVAALLAEPDPRKLLAELARLNVAINGRTAEIYRILVGASGSDAEAAALLTDHTRQRDRGQALIAKALVRTGALRPELRQGHVADVIHALMSPEMYQLLVVDRRWPPARYARWLADTLAAQLLAPTAPEAPTARVASSRPPSAGGARGR
jgi:AcrR family transcriptional regulator